MDPLIAILLCINVIGPVWYAGHKCLSRSGICVDHILLFTTGYLFYWIFPIALGTGHLLDTELFLRGWGRMFDAIPRGSLIIYLLFGIGFYGSFCLGSELGDRARFVKEDGSNSSAQSFKPLPLSFWERCTVSLPLLQGYFIVGLIYSGICAYAVRGEFFRGYLNGVENVGPRGSFVASYCFLLTLALVYTVYRESGDGQRPFGRHILNPYIFACLGVGILILSMGGRLYEASSIVMLMVYRTVYGRPFSIRGFLVTVGVLITLAGVVGTVRLGGNISAIQILVILSFESIGTSTSLLTFLRAGRLELLNWPRFLLFDFTNLIPSILLPNKSTLLLSPTQAGYDLYAPLGTLHSSASFMINFGIVGSLPFIFFMALGMAKLRRSTVPVYKVMYIMLSGWLAFSFFRDEFSISIVKLIFEFSIAIPILIVVSNALIRICLLPQQSRGNEERYSDQGIIQPRFPSQ